MSDNLKNDISKVVVSQNQNKQNSSSVNVLNLRAPQQSIYSQQIDMRPPQVLNENAEIYLNNN